MVAPDEHGRHVGEVALILPGQARLGAAAIRLQLESDHVTITAAVAAAREEHPEAVDRRARCPEGPLRGEGPVPGPVLRPRLRIVAGDSRRAARDDFRSPARFLQYERRRI